MKPVTAILAVLATAASSAVVTTRFVSGADSPAETVFVPITPCRLVDTRPGIDLNTGPRSSPVGNDETASFGAWATDDANSPCDVPSTATAIATNTVAIAPTARSFLTLYPADVDNPGTANLNFVAGQAPTPNAANIPLSDDGRFNVYNAFGEVNVVIDVNGYYQPSSTIGSTGPEGPEGPVGPAGADGADGTDGADGVDGPPGADGTDGVAGPAGPEHGRRLIGTSIVDSIGNAGSEGSLEIDAFGRSVIAYKIANQWLTLAVCDLGCLNPTTSQISTANDSDGNMALAIGSNGFPIIALHKLSNNGTSALDLDVVSCETPTCTQFSTTTLDSVGNVGVTPSITIGADGNPVISYEDRTNLTLKVAVCDDSVCSGATLRSVDTGGVGRYSSVSIGPDGLPVIAYSDDVGENLKVAKCSDATCAVTSINTVDGSGNVGRYPSLAFGPDGNPVISYWDITNEKIKVAACLDEQCNTASTNAVADTGSANAATSLTIAPDGNPLIAFFDSREKDLAIVSCETPDCSTATDFPAVTESWVGEAPDIAIGSTGQALIRYTDFATGDPMLASISNASWSENNWES